MAKSEKPAALYHGPKTSKKRARKKTRANLVTRTENMTEKRWESVIASIANGSTRRQAAHDAGISLQTLEAYLISNVAATTQLRDAQMLHVRKSWSYDELEEVLVQLASGKTVTQACTELGIDKKRLSSLYRILLKDKAIRKLYDEARELGAEAMADEIINISDESERDWDEDTGKPNHEVINRSRLRVDTRKWLMGKFINKRFGDIKHHEHSGSLDINHAAVLSGGRKRVEELHRKRQGATIEHDSGRVIINE